MSWLIYGDILEHHVVRSLCDELAARGIEVVRVPQQAHSHRYIEDAGVQETVRKNLEDALDRYDIEALFNFRVTEISPADLYFLRTRGVHTFGWFPDDPLLYNICYRHVAGSYDTVLHCGHEDVIRFYQERHPGINGVTFPFWTSTKYFPYNYDVQQCEFDLGFLGNCDMFRRKGRYELLAGMPFKTVFFGKLPASGGDPAEIHGGYIGNYDEIPNYIRRFKVGLNLPQFFRETEGEYSFDDLSRFESFYFPSRIIQYAACGIPTITGRTRNVDSIIPSLLVFDSREDLTEKVGSLVRAPAELTRLSFAIHTDFLNYLSARSRVDMLLYLTRTERPFDVYERVNLWKTFPCISQLPG